MEPGVEVPMPTLPSIINPPVGAAVPAYPIPTLAPPANALSPNTESFDTGLVVPMPTLPELFITNLSVVPSAVEDAIENLLLETSYPIVQEPAAAPENSNADFVAEYRVVRLFVVVVPMPTLPSIINPPVGAAVVSYPLPKLPPPLTLNIDPGAVSPMPTRPLLKMDKAFTLVADALREIKSSRWANSDPASRSSILNFAASPWAVALPSPPAAEPVPVKYPQLPNAREPAVAPLFVCEPAIYKMLWLSTAPPAAPHIFGKSARPLPPVTPLPETIGMVSVEVNAVPFPVTPP